MARSDGCLHAARFLCCILERLRVLGSAQHVDSGAYIIFALKSILRLLRKFLEPVS